MNTYYVMLCSGFWIIRNNSGKTLALKKLTLWSVLGQGVRALKPGKEARHFGSFGRREEEV